MDQAGMIAVWDDEVSGENQAQHLGMGTGVNVGPMVFVEGALREDVWVVSLSMTGVLDQREAVLGMSRLNSGLVESERFRAELLRGASVVIAQPMPLTGGEHRVMGFMSGHIETLEMQQDGKSDEIHFKAKCVWNSILESQLEATHFRTEDRVPWTVGALLERLNEVTSLELNSSCLKESVLEQRVEPKTLSTRRVGEVLKRLCESAGLRIEREMRWDGGRIIERRWVRPTSFGRRIGLGLNAWATGSNDVATLRGVEEASHPVKMIALADGVIVESTFQLAHGWDPAGEGLAASEYDRSTSSDFDAIPDVYRLWVLNEDGAYSEAPFNQATFNLPAFFDEGRSFNGQTTPFGQALSQGDDGRSLGKVVEISIDGGTTWSHETGRLTMLRDRAGLYLEADTLPTGWAAAGTLGLARVRITATITNPLAMESIRWKGNPFASGFITKRFELKDSFAYRRVDPTSKFAAEVNAGTRAADEVDEQTAMAAWLIEQSRRASAHSSKARITGRGIVTDVQVGDRLTTLAGRPIGLGAAAGTSENRDWVLDRITHRWDKACSELEFISND